jgi:excisionase family DNA binding protein
MSEGKEARAYNVETLAEHLRCSRRTVYNLIKTGKIRAFKIGKRGLRITPEEVERWQKESTQSDTGSGTSLSGGEKGSRLPTSTIRALVGARKE